MELSSTVILRTSGDMEAFDLRYRKESGYEGLRRVVLDGFIPGEILREGESLRFWRSDPQRIFEGGGDPFTKIRSILLRSLSPLSKIPQNSFVTLHVRNTIFPISFLTELGLSTRVGTLRYEFTENSPSYKVVAPGMELPLERLIMDYGSYLDCTGIDVENLVLYTVLCAGNISRARGIRTLAIIHPFNIVSDGEFVIPYFDADSEKDFDEQRNGYPFPNPPGLERIVIPEAQEFRYLVKETVLPDIVGIIPSYRYPSRVANGIKQARHPFERSVLPAVLLELYDNPPEFVSNSFPESRA